MRSYKNRPSAHYIVNKIMIIMLNYESGSLANGEKQSERSRCVEMVADCSKRPDDRLRTRVVPVQCAYVEWRRHKSTSSVEIVAMGLTSRRRRGCGDVRRTLSSLDLVHEERVHRPHISCLGLYLECSGRGCNGRAGDLGDGSPPAGSRGRRAPVGSGGEARRSHRYNVILCL